jgi:hypothetical protein
MCYQEGPRESRRTGIEGNTSVPLIYADDVNIWGEHINNIKTHGCVSPTKCRTKS